MPSVQIKNVPPEVHRVLRMRAATAGQSLQEYLLAELKRQAKDGDRARERLRGERLAAPELVDLEVV